MYTIFMNSKIIKTSDPHIQYMKQYKKFLQEQ